MNSIKIFLSFTLIFSFAECAYSQQPVVELPGTNVLRFTSLVNKQDYVLDIQLPGSYNEGTGKKYPVLYMLDGQWSFPVLRGITGGLYFDGFVPEMILVGITWPDNYDRNRTRDFTPTRIKEDSASGGGPLFLQVIKQEIIHLIDSTYRTDPNNNILTGGSFGGIFALYTLFHEPAIFRHYIIGSPSLDYDDGATFRFEKDFAARNTTLPANLFLHSSQYEEEMDQLNNFNKFTKQVKARNYKGLKMESLVVAEMAHASSGPYGGSRGLQFVFGKTAIKLAAGDLSKFTGQYKLFNDTFNITRTADVLYLHFRRGTMVKVKVRLYAETPERFYQKGIPGTLLFKKDDKGNVTGLDIDQNGNTIFVSKIN